MKIDWTRPWLLVGVLLLASCGGGAGDRSTAVRSLEAPSSVQVDAALCERAAAATVSRAEPSLVRYGTHGGHCVRQFVGLTKQSAAVLASSAAPDVAPAPASAPASARRHALAVTPNRSISATELLDWAETAYAQYFPSHQGNLALSSYVYRYYPETQNHLAVSDGLVYVQGPISGEALVLVGSLADFTCQVDPSACADGGRDCSPPASWTVGNNTCVPNAGQGAAIVSGTQVSFTDTEGSALGSASYACTDGSLNLLGTPSCEPRPPGDCDASSVSWTIGANTCTPDATEPKSVSSGTARLFTDSKGTVGSATFSCVNGKLTRTGGASCTQPQTNDCALGGTVEWTVDFNRCVADSTPDLVPHGFSAALVDATGGVTGRQTLACNNGVLQRIGDAVCIVEPNRLADSFGGDGGTADGGANGDGTAGDGAPIVGGIVRVVDVHGKSVFAEKPTDERGYYRVKLTGMVPPLVVSVIRLDGVIRRSISTQALKTNGYIFMAVTGLTQKIVSDIAQSAGLHAAADILPATVKDNPQAVDAAIVAIRNHEYVRPELIAAGINPDTFDPLSTPFRADGKGYDAVLDHLVVSTSDCDPTTIGPTYCVTPTSWTVANNTCLPDPVTPLRIGDGATVKAFDSVGDLIGSARFSCIKGVLQPVQQPNCAPKADPPPDRPGDPPPPPPPQDCTGYCPPGG